MKTIFVGDFESQEQVEHDFDFQLKPHEKLLLASYDNGGYDGSAWVLYQDQKENKLFEVNGSHCSCHGLEGQWEPEETSVASLAARLKDGHIGPYDVNITEQLKKVLGIKDGN